MTKPLEYTTFSSNPEFDRLAFQRTWPALVGVKNRVHFNFWASRLKPAATRVPPLPWRRDSSRGLQPYGEIRPKTEIYP